MTSRRRPPRGMRRRGVSYHMGRGSLLLPSSSLCWPRSKRVVDRRAQICLEIRSLRWVPDSRIQSLRVRTGTISYCMGIYSGTRVESTVELPAKNLSRRRRWPRRGTRIYVRPRASYLLRGYCCARGRRARGEGKAAAAAPPGRDRGPRPSARPSRTTGGPSDERRTALASCALAVLCRGQQRCVYARGRVATSIWLMMSKRATVLTGGRRGEHVDTDCGW
eukprot:SAG25_NODE_365_length_9126_cov_7.904952_2_plen_221_part_00